MCRVWRDGIESGEDSRNSSGAVEWMMSKCCLSFGSLFAKLRRVRAVSRLKWGMEEPLGDLVSWQLLGGRHFQPHSHRTSECKPHLIHFRFHCVTETSGFDRIKLEIDISRDGSRLSRTCKDIEHCNHAADDVAQALT
jgi:hypothetical protein